MHECRRSKLLRVLSALSLGLAGVFIAACGDEPLPTSGVVSLRPAIGAALEVRRSVERDLPAQRLDPAPRRPAQYDLERAIAAAGGRVLIGLKPRSAARMWDTGELAAITKDEAVSALQRVEALGIRVIKSYSFRPVIAARLTAGQLQRLLASDDVDYVEADGGGRMEYAVTRPIMAAALSGQDTTWAVYRVGAPVAWSQNQGQYVTVTMIDGGLDLTHTVSGDGPGALAFCLYDSTLLGDEPGCTAPQTGSFAPRAHASFVAGLINSRDDAIGGIGVAPALWQFNSLRACKRVSNYECPPGSVASGLQWAIDLNAPRHIVNISIGYCNSNATLQSAVQAALAAGILIVASAGNRRLSDPDCPSIHPNELSITDVKFPARYSGVLAVGGSMYDNGVPPLLDPPSGGSPSWEGAPCTSIGECEMTLQGFGSQSAGDSLCLGYGSRSGPEVSLVAPFWALSMTTDGNYGFACGTSFSAPLVTGVAALVWARYPSYAASQVKSHLQAASLPLSGGRRLAHAGLTLQLVIGMGGPQVIETEGTSTWTVTPPAHWPAPLSFNWYYAEASGGPWHLVGSGSSYFRYVSASDPGEFWIKVIATDGTVTASSTRHVTNAAVNPCHPYECD